MSKLIGVIVGVVLIVIGAGLNVWRINDLRTYAERVSIAKRNVISAQEVAAAKEENRRKTDGYVKKLVRIREAGILTNVQMVEAEILIRKWKEVDAELDVRVDKKIGMISGLDNAVIKKIRLDGENRERELVAEMKLLDAEMAAHREYIKKAKDFWHTNTPVIILFAVGALCIILSLCKKKK